jgi:ribulose-phosphate 3-epimerase
VKEKIIVPSVIAEDQAHLNHIMNILKHHRGWAQLDVMDGVFVDNHSLDFDFELPCASFRFEAQLMVTNPRAWIARHGEKTDRILAHYESLPDPEDFIRRIKKRGKEAGLALNPETPAEEIRSLLPSVSQILVMTVEPGSYGADFLPEMLDKVKKLRSWNDRIDIEVDGGINPATIRQADEAGANLFVSGSYLIKPGKFQERYRHLQSLIRLQP